MREGTLVMRPDHMQAMFMDILVEMMRLKNLESGTCAPVKLSKT